MAEDENDNRAEEEGEEEEEVEAPLDNDKDKYDVKIEHLKVIRTIGTGEKVEHYEFNYGSIK